MAIAPVPTWDHLHSDGNRAGLVVRSEEPTNSKNPSDHLLHLSEQDLILLDRIIAKSRVLIIEGISGSGKDTFQKYLKVKIKERDVYDYSEGEVLHSWKQLQIKGILELRVKFMKLFMNHIRDSLEQNPDAFFLLNRFHLSTYASTIVQNPRLRREYDGIIETLKALPVHVFILQLANDQIDQRSSHPERSSAWQKFQQQIVENYSFRDRLERQQRLILEAARWQGIPYSITNLLYSPEAGTREVHIFETPSITSNKPRTNIKASNKKRALSSIL